MLNSSFIVSLASLFVSLIGFANQVILAKLFGATISMDTYLIAVSLPLFVSGVFSVGLSYSMVPALMKFKFDRDSYRRFAGLMLISLSAIALAISVLGCFYAPKQIEILGNNLSINVRQDAITIARISWMTAGVMILVAYLRAVHNSIHRFLLATFASLIPQILMALSGLAFAHTYGPRSVAWGMFLGFIFSVPIMLIDTISEMEFSSKCMQMKCHVTNYLIGIPMVILSTLCFTAFQIIDAFWAPQMGDGNLASLGYSQRLLVSIGNIIIAGPIAVILPRLSGAYFEGRITDLLNDTLHATRMVIAFSAPIALSIGILSEHFVKILFERGAFDENATHGMSHLLPFMMAGMVAMLCVAMIFKALYSKQEVYWASILGFLTCVVYFVLSGFLGSRLGVEGLALAYLITWWLILILSIFILTRGNSDLILNSNNLFFISKMFLLIFTVSIVTKVGSIFIDENEKVSVFYITKIFVLFLFAYATYFLVAIRILKMVEIGVLFMSICRKFGFDKFSYK